MDGTWRRPRPGLPASGISALEGNPLKRLELGLPLSPLDEPAPPVVGEALRGGPSPIAPYLSLSLSCS